MYSYQFFNQTYIWSTPYLVQFYLKKQAKQFQFEQSTYTNDSEHKRVNARTTAYGWDVETYKRLLLLPL